MNTVMLRNRYVSDDDQAPGYVVGGQEWYQKVFKPMQEAEAEDGKEAA